jgi:hypothetical protein
MSFVLPALVILLFANAVIAFGIAFYWQVKVVFTLLGMSNVDGTHAPWNKDLSDPNSPESNFDRFIAGKIFPELRRKWLKAIRYVAVSFLAAFLTISFLERVAPEYIPRSDSQTK